MEDSYSSTKTVSTRKNEYQILYQSKYKTYIQSILEANRNHHALTDIQAHFEQEPSTRTRWLHQQVTDIIQNVLVHRLQQIHVHHSHHQQQQQHFDDCGILIGRHSNAADGGNYTCCDSSSSSSSFFSSTSSDQDEEEESQQDLLPSSFAEEATKVAAATAAPTPPELNPITARYFSSPIETTRKTLLQHSDRSTTPSFIIHTHTPITPIQQYPTPTSLDTSFHTQLSSKSSSRRKYLPLPRSSSWRKRVATSSGKKGMGMKKIHHAKIRTTILDENSYSLHNNQNHSWTCSLPKSTSSSSSSLFSSQDSHHSNPMIDTTILSPMSISSIQQPVAVASINKSWNLSHSPILPLHEDEDDQDDDDHHHHHYHHEMEHVGLRKGSLFHLRPLKVVQQRCRGRRHVHLVPFSNHHTNEEEEEEEIDEEEIKDITKTRGKHNKLHSNSISYSRQQTTTTTEYFASYESRIQSKLLVASRWLLCRDNLITTIQHHQPHGLTRQHINQHHRTAVIVNIIQPNHAMSLTLHMLAQHGTHTRHSFLSSSSSFWIPVGPISNNANIPGGTLIIVRSKEDLPLWERAFREQSGYSVWNHAIVPPKTRRRVADTVTKCAGTHVVLTTIDCIKSKEVPILVDSKGRPVDVQVHDQQGKHYSSQPPWFSSRNIGMEKKMKKPSKETKKSINEHALSDWDDNDDSLSSSSSSSSCIHSQPVVKVLSVLHGIRWHRLIFVDTLEKSYLIQQGGVRFEAATALHGSSR